MIEMRNIRIYYCNTYYEFKVMEDEYRDIIQWFQGKADEVRLFRQDNKERYINRNHVGGIIEL
jgi:hypothetical protein